MDDIFYILIFWMLALYLMNFINNIAFVIQLTYRLKKNFKIQKEKMSELVAKVKVKSLLTLDGSIDPSFFTTNNSAPENYDLILINRQGGVSTKDLIKKAIVKSLHMGNCSKTIPLECFLARENLSSSSYLINYNKVIIDEVGALYAPISHKIKPSYEIFYEFVCWHEVAHALSYNHDLISRFIGIEYSDIFNHTAHLMASVKLCVYERDNNVKHEVKDILKFHRNCQEIIADGFALLMTYQHNDIDFEDLLDMVKEFRKSAYIIKEFHSTSHAMDIFKPYEGYILPVTFIYGRVVTQMLRRNSRKFLESYKMELE